MTRYLTAAYEIAYCVGGATLFVGCMAVLFVAIYGVGPALHGGHS